MKIKFILTSFFLLASFSLFASDRQIPLLFNFQGALADEGGNSLPDGLTSLTFRVLDSSGTLLYEEAQNVEVVKGGVSAIIGNGINPSSGSATGGVPADVFDPKGSVYLQVEAEGQKPYDAMEVVTAPYALWADTALKVVPGAITGEMISKGVITKEHLDEQLFSALFPNGFPKSLMPSDTVYSEDFTSFKDTIQSSAGASQVGVAKKFIYSGSGTVEGVLGDLDIAIKKRHEEVEFAKKDYGTQVGNEATARQNADANEAVTRQNADNLEALSRAAADNNEAAARASADSNEANTRAASDGSLQSQIANEIAERIASDNSILYGSESLSNKVIVAPLIVSGSNVNPNVAANLSGSTNAGTTVDGNITITGKVNVSSSGAVRDVSSGDRVTPFAYARIYNELQDAKEAAVQAGYNISSVYEDFMGCAQGPPCYNITFSTPSASDNYIVIIQMEPQQEPSVSLSHAAYVKSQTSSGFVVANAETNKSLGGFSFVVYSDL